MISKMLEKKNCEFPGMCPYILIIFAFTFRIPFFKFDFENLTSKFRIPNFKQSDFNLQSSKFEPRLQELRE